MNRRQMLRGSAAAVVTAGVAPMAGGTTRRSPNFIVIYCDDLGYGDIGPMGGRAIPTPNLDRMAREGLTLTDYYAPANVCTPSRAGLLTGRYPIRSGMSRVLLAGDKRGLPLDEVTIPEALGAGYRSAWIGKWHLGHVETSWPPTRQGFDLFYGLPYSHDIEPLKVHEFDRTGQRGEWEPDYPQLQQNFYDRAERFIDDAGATPFFLTLALSSPHLPNYPAAGFEGRSKAAGAYGDTVVEIDAIVGRLMAKLRAAGIDRDTLVIFTSDNGPWYEGSTGGLRQRKGGGASDGGYRVPFVARWPGAIPAGTRSDAIAMGIDLLPTFCALAGVAPPAGRALDGRDITTVLTRRGPSPHDELVLFQNDDVVGIRTQKWKYVDADLYMTFLVNLQGRGYPQLYDMADLTEQYSVASLHPDIVKAMQARITRARATFGALRTSTSNPLADQVRGQPKHHVPALWRDD